MMPGTEVSAPSVKSEMGTLLPLRREFEIKMLECPSDLSIFDSKATDIYQQTRLHMLLFTRGHTPTHAPLSLIFKSPWHLAGCILLPATVQLP